MVVYLNMAEEHYYKLDLKIGEAMKIHNDIMPEDKFTLLDLNILCHAKSFHEKGYTLYMTNKQLGDCLFATEKTVQTSVNRLCAAGLLTKEYTYKKNEVTKKVARKRKLIYQADAVQRFMSLLKEETECNNYTYDGV